MIRPSKHPDHIDLERAEPRIAGRAQAASGGPAQAQLGNGLLSADEAEHAIDELRGLFGIASLTGQGIDVRHACRTLGVSESGYCWFPTLGIADFEVERWLKQRGAKARIAALITDRIACAER
jgi:hypothetical protein